MHTRVCRIHAARDIRVETDPLPEPGPAQVIVAMAAAGICGSDLHYYHDGGFGPIRVREPMILGHEGAGVVAALGPGVTGLAVGDRVAVNPSRPCGTCSYCVEGLTTHCLNMRFYGSAMRFPHEQGLFRDKLLTDAAQCHKLSDHVTISEGACAEPLAVCLHARHMAGEVRGKRVLVTGSGPIGVLCAAVAAEAGAAEIVVTDLQDAPLEVARRMGATRTVNVAREVEAMAAYAVDKGHFDLVFECSAAAPAIHSAIAALRPQGTYVQVGVTGDVPLPVNLIVGKELCLQGTQRFRAEEFAEAVRLISSRRIDLRAMISGSFPLEQAEEAFRMAADRSRAVKVHLTFADS